MSDLLSARELSAALGGKSIGRGQYMAKCPAHTERTGSLSIRDGYSGPLVHCFGGCEQRDVIAALQDRGLWPSHAEHPPIRRPSPPRLPSAQREATPEERTAYARRIWRDAGPAKGTLAEAFLASRELTLDSDLDLRVLRFHRHCPFGTEKHPCLLAAFVPIEGLPPDEDSPVAIQRIALDPDQPGYQIGKMSLGPTGGAAIKLDADEEVEQGLGLAEGLATALSVRAIGWRPVWATGSAGAMGGFPVLPGIEALTLFADNDDSGTGERKANECTVRWRQAGREVTLYMPRGRGNDWADEWSVR